MRVKCIAILALLMRDVVSAPIPEPRPMPEPLTETAITRIAFAGAAACVAVVTGITKQQNSNTASLEKAVKETEKIWEERIKGAKDAENIWKKEREEREKEAKKSKPEGGKGGPAASVVSENLAGTTSDPRCWDAFSSYWKKRKEYYQEFNVAHAPPASTWNPFGNGAVNAHATKCRSDILVQRSIFDRQYDLYRIRHGLSKLAPGEFDVTDVPEQTEADLDRSIMLGCSSVFEDQLGTGGLKPTPSKAPPRTFGQFLTGSPASKAPVLPFHYEPNQPAAARDPEPKPVPAASEKPPKKSTWGWMPGNKDKEPVLPLYNNQPVKPKDSQILAPNQKKTQPPPPPSVNMRPATPPRDPASLPLPPSRPATATSQYSNDRSPPGSPSRVNTAHERKKAEAPTPETGGIKKTKSE